MGWLRRCRMAAPDSAIAAEMELRQQTGGFRLISAKEVQPGLLVFRLRDQTPLGTEVLGTLQVRVDSSPAAIASFSLRAVAAQLAAKGAARGCGKLAPVKALDWWFGGRGRNRTYNQSIKSRMLCQLSYASR